MKWVVVGYVEEMPLALLACKGQSLLEVCFSESQDSYCISGYKYYPKRCQKRILRESKLDSFHNVHIMRLLSSGFTISDHSWYFEILRYSHSDFEIIL